MTSSFPVLHQRHTTMHPITGKVINRWQTVYRTVSLSEDMNTLQADLDIFQELDWTWDREFNSGNSKVLNITRSSKPLQFQHTPDAQLLESADSAKYLGITVTKDLNENTHIASLQKLIIKHSVLSKGETCTLWNNDVLPGRICSLRVVSYSKQKSNTTEMVQWRMVGKINSKKGAAVYEDRYM